MSRPVILTREEFAARDYPPVETVLDPWLTTGGIALISGYPGSGKTFVGLTAAVAIATGGDTLGWSAPTARSILYIDGEMDPAETRQRFDAIERSIPPSKLGLLASNFSILSHVDQPDGIPNLSTLEGQRWIESAIDHDVIFFDNIGTLFRLGDEKEEKDWKPCQEWLVALRAAGITQVLFHHTGKPHRDALGQVTYSQHGTSARERVPNVTGIIAPVPHTEGTFTLHWEKWRGTGGKRKPPPASWEIQWTEEDGICDFVPYDPEEREIQLNSKIQNLSSQGLTKAAISREVGIGAKAVSRRLGKIMQLIPPKSTL